MLITTCKIQSFNNKSLLLNIFIFIYKYSIIIIIQLLLLLFNYYYFNYLNVLIDIKIDEMIIR
jgi:hypothetical protein